MRIALVSQEFPPETAQGGIGTQTYHKAHGLAALGHETYVISRSRTGDASEHAHGPVRVIRISGFESKLPLYTEVADWLTYSAQVAEAVARLHARAPLDLIDFPEYAAEGYVHLLNRTRWNWIPTVIQLHGPLVMLAHTIGWPEINSDFYRLGVHMEGVSLQRADAIYSSSACSAAWCAKHYGTPASCPVIHTGVDTNHFFPRPQPKDPDPTVVFVGRVVPSKGADILVDAVGELRRELPRLRLRLIGKADNAFRQHLQARFADGGVADWLDLPGFVDREHLPEELSRAHVFAAPSLYEPGPGLVNLEAMACGLPVIACEGAGAAEVVNGQNGLLVPPGNLKRLVQALRQLLGDTTVRTRMSQDARNYVLAEADSRTCLRKLESFYGEVGQRAENLRPADHRARPGFSSAPDQSRAAERGQPILQSP